MKTGSPTSSQETALRMAYSCDHILSGYSDEFGGVARSTLRSIRQRRWVEPADPEEPEDELVLTKDGRKALGLAGALLRPPKRMRTALIRAVGHFLDEGAPLRDRSAIFPPRRLSSAVWVNDEQCADFGEALLLVDMDEADLSGFEEVDWCCVARLVSELGFPCHVTRTRYIQAFWPEETS